MSKPTDEFMSPPELVELAKRIFGGPIDFDPYGHASQLIPARDLHSLQTGAEPWPETGNWWCNPPFSESKFAVPRIAEWYATHREINGLLLCLAAPGSVYWRESIWSVTHPQRIAWLPRLKFYRIGEDGQAYPTTQTITRDLALGCWSRENRVLARFDRFLKEFAKPELKVESYS